MKVKKLMLPLIGCLIFGFLFLVFFQKYQHKKQVAQVKEILLIISEQLNKGNTELYQLSRSLSKGDDALKNIDVFPNTITKANTILINTKNTKK